MRTRRAVGRTRSAALSGSSRRPGLRSITSATGRLVGIERVRRRADGRVERGGAENAGDDLLDLAHLRGLLPVVIQYGHYVLGMMAENTMEADRELVATQLLMSHLCHELVSP